MAYEYNFSASISLAVRDGVLINSLFASFLFDDFAQFWPHRFSDPIFGENTYEIIREDSFVAFLSGHDHHGDRANSTEQTSGNDFRASHRRFRTGCGRRSHA
jgi:hypothetical protein